MPFDDADWAPAADIAKPEAQAAQKTADAAATKADAAKSTADAAQSAADRISVGGRNLVLKSGVEVTDLGYLVARWEMSEATVVGQTYTATIDVTPADGVSRFGLYLDGGFVYDTSFSTAGTDRQTVSRTFTKGAPPASHPATDSPALYRFPNDGSVTGATTIHSIKIERGNRATDWTPAPEDVQSGIDAAQTTADTATTKADAAQKTADTVTGDLTSFVRTVDKTVDGLQAQIDGSIQTWFYEVAPTGENAPASDWTTAALRNNHLGDLYYDTRTGYCYRYQVEDNAYSWQRVTDVDVTKALADAAQAQDTADHKRRVFTSTPTTPYDVGDLWTDGKDLRRCRVEKASAQSYEETDWELATGYTDDTKADAAAAAAKAAQDTASATDQCFWNDTEGVHVSETGDHDLTGGNVLLTAAKLAIRKALDEVASFSEKAASFCRGLVKVSVDQSWVIADEGGTQTKGVVSAPCGVVMEETKKRVAKVEAVSSDKIVYMGDVTGATGEPAVVLYGKRLVVGESSGSFTPPTSYPLDNLRSAMSLGFKFVHFDLGGALGVVPAGTEATYNAHYTSAGFSKIYAAIPMASGGQCNTMLALVVDPTSWDWSGSGYVPVRYHTYATTYVCFDLLVIGC